MCFKCLCKRRLVKKSKDLSDVNHLSSKPIWSVVLSVRAIERVDDLST